MLPVHTVTSMGAVAARLLRDGAAGRVAAVFASSLHVELAESVVCLVAADLGNGPLNAVVAARRGEFWRPVGLSVGMPAQMSDGRLTVADVAAFSLASARPWLPPPWPEPWQAPAVRAALQELVAEAAPRCPAEGLAAAILGQPMAGGLGGAVARRALLATATLADWLSLALQPGAAPDPDVARAASDAVRMLLGLGPGLTPAGDDVLCGLMVALHAAGAVDAARALAGFVTAAPPTSTTALSRAFLGAAAEGLPAETMARLVAALLAGGEPSFAAHLDEIDTIGQTSGWDMLGGVVMGLSAVAAARLDAAI